MSDEHEGDEIVWAGRPDDERPTGPVAGRPPEELLSESTVTRIRKQSDQLDSEAGSATNGDDHGSGSWLWALTGTRPAVPDEVARQVIVRLAMGAWEAAGLDDSGTDSRSGPLGQAVWLGYEAGRMLVGTVDQELRWSTGAPDEVWALLDVLESVDQALVPSFVSWGFVEHSDALCAGLASEVAQDDGYLDLVAEYFDLAVALAWVEHDRCTHTQT